MSDRSRGEIARRAFELLVTDLTDNLIRTGYLLTFDLAETEDLVQETFVRVARQWDRVGEMEHPAAYARRVLVNLVIDGRKRRSRRTDELSSIDPHLDRLADTSVDRALDNVDSAAEFRWALEQLSPRTRAVIVLRYWEDRSEADVAQLLACSVGTVKSTASRGMAQLRAAMTDSGHGAPETAEIDPEGSPHGR